MGEATGGGAAEKKGLALLSKIKPRQWKEMARTVTEMKELTEEGGVGSLTDSIAETISLQFDSFLSPLTNEINAFLTSAIKPYLEDIIKAINDLTAFMTEGAEGAFVGAIVGAIASIWLPGGTIWIAFGAMIGSAVQQAIEDFFSTPDMQQWKNDVNQLLYEISQGNWAALAETIQDILFAWNKGAEGFLSDIGRGWSGFWRDIGWK